jgi:murein DD-endopeptidase MepM/ murein hydrolase activator NlpD
MPNSSDEIDFAGPTLGPPTGHEPPEPPPPAHHPAKPPPARHPAEKHPAAKHPPAHHEPTVHADKHFFPLFHRPLADYRTGARFFGAPRTPTRKHAACDLIAGHLWSIRAIADGTVIQPPYFFYTGTNALEVKHPGIGTVRYGEIDMHKVIHLRSGQHVKAGEVIAYVGRLDSGASMLHFELYSGKGSGPLTVYSGAYMRRWDLVNPTSLVDRLLKHTF